MVLVNYPDSDSEASETFDEPSARPRLQSSLLHEGDSTSSLSSAPTPASNTPRKRKAEDNIKSNRETTSGQKSLPPQPPPLPSKFHSLYATNVRTSTSDDPSLHGGRRRQTVHIRGNWPSHIYLEWFPDKNQLERLDEIILTAQEIIHRDDEGSDCHGLLDTRSARSAHSEPGRILTPFTRSQLSTPMPLHISFSAPLSLTTSTKGSFQDALITAVSRANIGSITVAPKSLDLVPNFEESRWFLILRLKGGEKRGQSEKGEMGKLERLLDVCNGVVCKRFNLPGLYNDSGQGMVRVKVGADVGVNVDAGRDLSPRNKERKNFRRSKLIETKQTGAVMTDQDTGRNDSDDGDIANAFHISIAWMLKELAPKTRNEIQQIATGVLSQERIVFDRVKVKIGNVVDDILL